LNRYRRAIHIDNYMGDRGAVIKPLKSSCRAAVEPFIELFVESFIEPFIETM
jgi:hypothetical protein